ncbi:hypothetical protein P168DRAFT_315029 [Aspergillus campestris IBT 28561]|uniref:F-box domain-containing protein n=1 Tax=Aspergillus campestris (strain IBT 28561) TaxID=1392248 RepID=A0A2I1DGI7_ASPC2|nr:uncharacterized protein P168DRAFT_315029 [Aspergillus campestris IBT 28561]PKY08987.1 hypothetical protein P168DRAFT_315029 [Aspergillus campestris IBT 28561]
MPAPALPIEMLDHIFSYIHPDQYVVSQRNQLIPWRTGYNLCLVNHNFYFAASARLYHTFIYDGSFHERNRPWKFLRTIVESPRLANQVRTVDIQHMLKHNGPRSRNFVGDLVDDYLEIVGRAVIHAGFSELGLDNIVGVFRINISTPLAALIIACLPRLRTLYMNFADEDAFMEILLSYAVNVPSRWVSNKSRPQGPILQQLERLFVASDGNFTRGGYSLQIDENRPFTFLPSLRQLTLIKARLVPDILTWSSPPYNATLPPHLTRLAIDLGDCSQLSELWCLLDSLPGLTHLSLDFSGVPSWVLRSYSNAVLWKRLARFQDTLEELDISMGPSSTFGDPPRSFSPGCSPFCTPVWQFHKLKRLSIQPDILLGNCKDHPAPTQPVGHLADGLERLLLYGWFSISNNMETMLECIARIKHPPRKIYVVSAGTYDVLQFEAQQLEHRCAARGIPVKITIYNQIPYGNYWAS